MNEHVTSYSTVQEFRVSELVNGKMDIPDLKGHMVLC